MGHSLPRFLLFLPLAFLLLAASPNQGWTAPLPAGKQLIVRLSTLSSSGGVRAFSKAAATTDSSGKITFSFPVVPSSEATPFLYLQIVDGVDILRRAVVPAPLPGGQIDVGISETTDLQARTLLKAAELSGRISSVHLLVTHALVRTPAITAADAESAAAAVVAGAAAFNRVLASDDLTKEQLADFTNSLARSLREVTAGYRQAVDDASASDPDIEAARRGEAFAVLLQGMISAGRGAGINLETVATAFAGAAGDAETLLDSNRNMAPLGRAGMRFSFLSGVINLSNYRLLREMTWSLEHVGVTPPRFAEMFSVIDLIWNTTTLSQKGADVGLMDAASRGDIRGLRAQEFNSLAIQDLMWLKFALQSMFASNKSQEYADLMLEITDRMAGMGGVMTGMTPALLMEILGRPVFPPSDLGATATAQGAASIPTLIPFELAIWSYIHKEASFVYTPVPGLADTLDSKPEATPAFHRLAEPHRSLALLMYDLQLVLSLRWQDQRDADAYNEAHPMDPPGSYPLPTVHRILENNRQRLILVRRHISGVPPETADALIYLLGGRGTEF